MTAQELNEHIADGSIDELIRVSESRQVKALSRMADDICARGNRRLILLAGGSSSGKTTTAKRLGTQLRVNGLDGVYLSTDDYFVGDAKNPRDENGKLDYEHVECVDIKRLSSDINALLQGEPVPKRVFDFVNHVPVYTDEQLLVPKHGFVIVEGIHALNPRLTSGVSDAVKYKISIDPRPSIDLFGGVMPSSADARFIRRIVRDSHFRKTSPVKTIELWPSVLAGESKWIDPFRAGADAQFDSYLVYELAALKFYAGGLLERARREVGEVPLIMNAIRTLSAVTAIDTIKVPGNSILRETIGGSQLDY